MGDNSAGEKYNRKDEQLADVSFIASNGNTAHGKESDIEDATSEKELTPVKTLAYCNFIVRRHKLAFGLTLTGHILLIVVSGILVRAGYNLFPLQFTGVPLTLKDDATYLRGLAWNWADNSDIHVLRPTFDANNLERSTTTETLALYYEADNVFTKERLQALKAWEDELTSDSEYSKFCVLISPNECRKPLSVLRFFDGTYSPLLNDSSFDDVPATMFRAMNNPVSAQILQFHLGKDAEISSTLGTARSPITRSIIYLGHSVDEEVKTFLVNRYRTKLYSKVDTGISGMSFIFSSSSLFQYDIQRQVIFDMLLAGGSFAFICLFMLIQTQSLMVTGLALFSILTSFCGANLVYRIVLDYQYFGIFHVLSVFIILGIGADDVFVYFDTWRGTAHENHPTLEERVSACYRRASKSMFVTSLTTMIAFFVNGFSPLLSVSSFGIFSGILVIVNYISVIVFFPTVVVMYHKHWEDWTWPCCRCCKKPTVSPSHNVKDGHRHHPVVRFFYGPFNTCVSHPIVKWVSVGCCLILLCVFIYFATLLKPQEEEVKIYKDTHNYQKATDRNLNAFKPSVEDRVINVYLAWGLKNQDVSACHKTDLDCRGKTVWDEGFDLNPKPSQNALLDLCVKMRNLTDQESKPLSIRRDSVTGLLDIDCFIIDFNNYMTELSKDPIYNNEDLSLPTSETKMNVLMQANPQLYNTSQDFTNFYRYFETGLSFWLYGKHSSQAPTQFKEHAENIGFVKDDFDTRNIINQTSQVYGTRLRYAAIVAHTTIKMGTLGYESGLPVIEAWEDFTKKEMSKMPPSMTGGFQCTPERNNPWHWVKVQKTLADTAVKGIIISICLAFPILTFATQNIVLGFLATVCISCVTVTIVGIIPLANWKLGVLESLNLSLVVGLAVDYVVHLAEGYHMSRHEHRQGRLRDMLGTVGISVISGACTTLGASLFMLFAEILFFMQFGIFMFCTIGFSIVYALFLFAPMLAIIGPEREFGSLAPIWRWLMNWIKGRKKSDVDCGKCNGKGFHPEQAAVRF